MEHPSDRAAPPEEKPAAPRPRYEPPRLVKKRSVARATLFSGQGPPSIGLTGHDDPR